MNSCRRSFLAATARTVLLVQASGLPWAESRAAAAAPPVSLVRIARALTRLN